MIARQLVLSGLLLSAALPSLSAVTLTGSLLQEHSSAPVPSAGIRVRPVGNRTLAAELETDAQGRCRAAGLADGDYEI